MSRGGSRPRGKSLKGDVVVWRFVSPALMVLAVCTTSSIPAFAAENYQTNIGPTPLDGSNRTNVLGRGSVLATLGGSKFTLHGTFAGLATPATDAHLCMGAVMGGTGPAIHDVTVTPSAKRSGLRHGHADPRAGRGLEGRQDLSAAQQPESAQGKSLGLVSAGAQNRRTGCARIWTLVHPEHPQGRHRPGKRNRRARSRTIKPEKQGA